MSEINEKINVHVNPEGSKLIISHANELEPRPPISLDITGNIETPVSFWKLRKQDYDRQKCHILVTSTTITLIVNEDEPWTRGRIQGVLTLDKECANFGINDDNRTYTNMELSYLVKKNEFLFPIRNEWVELYNSLTRFQANVQLNIKDIKESTGDREKAIQITVNKDLKNEFELKTKIFGDKREAYIVNIGAEVVGQDVKFYLDSSQLAFRIQELKDQLINEQLAYFGDELVIVKQ